jgi:hypothetical protein
VLRDTELPKARENVLRVAPGGPALLQEDGEKTDEVLVKVHPNVLDDVLFLDLRDERHRKDFVAVEANQAVELLADLIGEIHRGLNSLNNLLTPNHSLAASRNVTNKMLTRVDRQTRRDSRLGCKCPANIVKELSDLSHVSGASENSRHPVLLVDICSKPSKSLSNSLSSSTQDLASLSPALPLSDRYVTCSFERPICELTLGPLICELTLCLPDM